MKKFITTIALAAMLTLATFLAANAASPDEGVLIPLRATFEDAGATASWQSYDRTIHIYVADDTTIVLHTRYPRGYVNDRVIHLQDGITIMQDMAFITPGDLALLFSGGQPDNNIDFISTARNLMDMFATGDINGMLQTMQLDEISEMMLHAYAGVYQSLILQRGSILNWEMVGYYEIEGGKLFHFDINHSIGQGGITIAITNTGEFAGLQETEFTLTPIPPQEGAAYYANPVVIGDQSPWALDGILTMPHSASADAPVPAVVLVHGSGPGNKDSSVFDNRPFHDIASFLSSNGIAVLRYNKRTLTHGMAFMQAHYDSFTVWEETIEDAILASEILLTDPRVSRVYVLGLSLGGSLAPRIAEEAGLDGVIMLGAFARPAFEVSYDQNILSISGAVASGLMSQEEADYYLIMVADLLAEAQTLSELTDEEMQGREIFGLPAVYQRSIVDSLPIPIIMRNHIPTLILHGGRDWQVSQERDFQRFVEYVGKHEHVTTMLHEGINHIFMQSMTEYNDLRDYAISGHVDAQVLAGIVEWINGNH